LNPQSVDSRIFNMVENQSGPQIRSAYLEPHILQRKSVDVASIQTVSWHWTEHEILSSDFRQIAPSGIFCSASSSKSEMDIVEGDVFHHRSANAIKCDAGVSFARSIAAGDGSFCKLRRVRCYRAMNVTERYITNNCRG